MAQLDDSAWVLEPETPNFSDLHRRIVVAKHAYLDITIKYDCIIPTLPPPLSHVFEVMQRILELLLLHWHWSGQRPLAHLFAFKSEIIDGPVTGRLWRTFFVPCLLRPFRHVPDLLAQTL